MSDTTLLAAVLLEGANAFAYLVAACFFLRFWKRTKDRLFVLFAISFTLLAIGHVAVTCSQAADEKAYFYLTRLLAFLLIIGAIVDKNRVTGAPKDQ